MQEFFLSLEYIIGLVIDVVVLYFAAQGLRILSNSARKAVTLTLVSATLGYILGPLMLALPLVSLNAFFLTLVATLFIRLTLIKIVYKIGFSKALSIWVVTAVVSIVVWLLMPFY